MMLPAGQRIEARFGGKLKYFPGRIVKANDDGTYEIRYDDGDTEISVAPDLISAPSPPGTFKVGEAVQSRFGGKHVFYGAKVVKDNGDGTWELHYDDGDVEKYAKFLRPIDIVSKSSEEITNHTKENARRNQESPATRTDFTIGQRVEARFGGKGKYFGGKITRVNGDGSYDIAYDDGDSERGVMAELIRGVKTIESSSSSSAASASEYAVGTKVEARFGGKGKYFGGKITRVHGDGSFDIAYDDGDSERGVKAELIRGVKTMESSSAGAASAASLTEYEVGTKVEARFGGKGKYFGGKITRVNGDGSYDIAYDDGDSERGVMAELIRGVKTSISEAPASLVSVVLTSQMLGTGSANVVANGGKTDAQDDNESKSNDVSRSDLAQSTENTSAVENFKSATPKLSSETQETTVNSTAASEEIKATDVKAAASVTTPAQRKADRALFAAAACGDRPAAAAAVEAGARVNVRHGALKQSALLLACHRGDVQLATYLLGCGADPSLAGYGGQTPLHEAAMGCCARLVTCLLANNHNTSSSSPDSASSLPLLSTVTNARGATPLHALAHGAATRHIKSRGSGHNGTNGGNNGDAPAAVLALLLKHGADAGAVDHAGKTALEVALAEGGDPGPVEKKSVQLPSKSTTTPLTTAAIAATGMHNTQPPRDAPSPFAVFIAALRKCSPVPTAEAKAQLRVTLNASKHQEMFKQGHPAATVGSGYGHNPNKSKRDQYLVASLEARAANNNSSSVVHSAETKAALAGKALVARFLEAASNGDVYVLHHCLADGAPIDSVDRFGQTALHAAAFLQHEGAVRLLLSRGANPTMLDKHGDSAHALAIEGHTSHSNGIDRSSQNRKEQHKGLKSEKKGQNKATSTESEAGAEGCVAALVAAAAAKAWREKDEAAKEAAKVLLLEEEGVSHVTKSREKDKANKGETSDNGSNDTESEHSDSEASSSDSDHDGDGNGLRAGRRETVQFAPGQRIERKHLGGRRWRAGTVVRARLVDGSCVVYDIEYDLDNADLSTSSLAHGDGLDGSGRLLRVEGGVEGRLLRLNRKDAALANYNSRMVHSSTEDNTAATAGVNDDDGDDGNGNSPVLFKLGDRVEAMHPLGGNDWFPGIVTAVVLPTPVPASSSGTGEPGTVTSSSDEVAEDLTTIEVCYAIDYDDGDREKSVVASKVRALIESDEDDDDDDEDNDENIDKNGKLRGQGNKGASKKRGTVSKNAAAAAAAAATARAHGLVKGARVEVLPRGYGNDTNGLWRAATVAAVHQDGSVDVNFLANLHAPPAISHHLSSWQREIRCDPSRIRVAAPLAKGCSAACAIS